MDRPFVVGICGGIGSGKSAAARVFERLGAKVIDADRIAHEVLREPEVRSALRSHFGDRVVTPAGEVDRGALSKEVFGGTPKQEQGRQALEALVHPRILERISRAIEEFSNAQIPRAIVIIDAPLLWEGRLRALCDRIVFVEASEQSRFARTAAERSWNVEHHKAREVAQAPLEQKRAGADHVIQNNGSEADLAQACERLFESWRKSL